MLLFVEGLTNQWPRRMRAPTLSHKGLSANFFR